MTLVPDPIALCLEDLDASSENRRYLQCVSVAGGRPGLVLDHLGHAQWRPPSGSGVELWVSADSCLMLFRCEGAIPVTVRRAGRSLDAPFERPVILLDQDRIELAGRRLLVHIHGIAPVVVPPTWLEISEPASGQAKSRAAAAAMALGVAVAGGACGKQAATQAGGEPAASAPVDMSARPVTVGAAVPDVAATDAAAADSAEPSASASAPASATKTTSAAPGPPSATNSSPIQVRIRPPRPAFPTKDK